MPSTILYPAHSQEQITGRIADKAAQLPRIGLLTGGRDPHYVIGLARALARAGIKLDLIGSDELDSPELHPLPGLRFLNLRRDQGQNASLLRKVSRVASYYFRLVGYAATSKAGIFHILWNNKFEVFDRTILMLYYKLLGKKIVLTVHNVNAGIRDANDSAINRLTLTMQYRLADHLFVHTAKMKTELERDFGVMAKAISIIPYGINDAVPDTSLTAAQAREALGIAKNEKVILFFGAVRPYKGIEYLLSAFESLSRRDSLYKLILAGEPKKESIKYLQQLQTSITTQKRGRILSEFRYIRDDETEIYFKAADLLILPYTEIFQSGVLFLGYSFGLPVVASDVGSLRDDVIEGQTGYLCKPADAEDLANTIEKYFRSDLFSSLPRRRPEIRDFASSRHSWKTVAEMTRNVYADLC